jgi:hypothetical protein
MNAEPFQPDDEQVVPLARAVYALEVEQAPRQHSQRTPQCPSLPRFGVALVSGWTAAEEAHVRGCPYCRKVAQMFAHAEAPPPKFQASDPVSSVAGFSAIGRSDPDLLVATLRPWMPFLLRRVGLDEGGVEPALSFIRSQLPLPAERRFRDLLPGWLAALAHQQGTGTFRPLTAEGYDAIPREGAIDLAVSAPDEDAPEVAAVLRERHRQRPLADPDDLLRVDLPPELGRQAWVKGYLLEKFRQARAKQAEGRELFECV